jgi:hypothetical protein
MLEGTRSLLRLTIAAVKVLAVIMTVEAAAVAVPLMKKEIVRQALPSHQQEGVGGSHPGDSH